MGKYIERGERPLKVKFRAQTTAIEVILYVWKLDKIEQYREVWIKRDMNEERLKVSDLIKEAKAKNGKRTEEEKKSSIGR